MSLMSRMFHSTEKQKQRSMSINELEETAMSMRFIDPMRRGGGGGVSYNGAEATPNLLSTHFLYSLRVWFKPIVGQS